MRKFLIYFAFLSVFFMIADSFGSQVVVDKIVATVEGQPITAYELENIAGFYRAKNTKALLNKVINDYVLMHYAKKSGIVVTDEDVDKYIDNLAAKNNLSPDMFLRKIESSGLDIKYYKTGIRLALYRRKFALRMFAPTIHITDTDIERYYKLHKKEFKTNPVLVMSIISVKDKKLANSIYEQLKNGADFMSLKKKFSMDRANERAIPLSAFNKQIQNELKGLNVGDISNIIEANNVYYIVKILDKKGENVNLETMKDRIRNILFAQRIESKLASWLKMVKSRTDIEIFQ